MGVRVLMRKMATTLFSKPYFPHVGGNGGGDCRVHWRGGGVQADCGPCALHESQSSIISHPTQYRNMLLLSCLHIPKVTLEWVISANQ